MTAFNSGLKTAIPHIDQEERLNPKVRAVAENADEDGNCDWKYHEQPDVVEHSDQLLMGHV
jgi:hypothetical protein